MAKKIKVGFDLDGVILYNPVRIFRPIASFLKPLIFKKKFKDDNFYFPHSFLEKIIWALIHKTSIWPASGLEEIKKLTKNNKIQAYIITARYSFLKKDFDKWMKFMDANDTFTGCFYNELDEQPNVFKDKMIKKLNLDIFVEDNWGVVQKLNESNNKYGKKIFWIYNVFDRRIIYPHKFSSLKKVLEYIKKKYL